MGYLDKHTSLPDGKTYEPDAERVKSLCDIMIEGVYHPAPPWHEREKWDAIAGGEAGRNIIAEAADCANRDPLMYMTDEIYCEAVQSGNFVDSNSVRIEVFLRTSLLPLAEGIAPTGMYIEQIERDIEALANLRIWSSPAHEQAKDLYEGKDTFPDLITFHYATNLITADRILGDRLSPKARCTIRDEIQKRIFDLVEERIRTGKNLFWWFTVEHNWNSACLASLLACALYLKETLEDRAWYTAVVETFIVNSERGFTESGFYREGVGYWRYGFGHYILAAELMRAVTSGRVDWLEKPIAERTSRFGYRIEIQDCVYPTFADCASDVVPDPWIVYWMHNRKAVENNERTASSGHQTPNMAKRVAWVEDSRRIFSLLYALPLFHQVDPDNVVSGFGEPALRDWFEDVQFLICRPEHQNASRLAATFIGGDNGANHNHNDLGTFTVLIDDASLICDPGAEVYTMRTFSPNRYDGNLLNSYGHPVPVVDGQLQVPGARARAEVVDVRFSDDMDMVELDLTSAYPVEKLLSLRRRFTFTRGSTPSLVITDEFEYSSPGAFETALITYERWSRTGPGSVRISAQARTRPVAIDVHVTPNFDDGGIGLITGDEIIRESSTPTRIFYRLESPAIRGRIVTTITPSNVTDSGS